MDQTQKKLLTKFSNKFEILFFGQKNFFSKNAVPSRAIPHEPLTPRCVSEKTNQAIPRKLPDGRTVGQKDRRTEGWTDSNSTAGVPKRNKKGNR